MRIGFDIDGTVADYWSAGSAIFLRRILIGPIILFLLDHAHKQAWARWLIEKYVIRAMLLMKPTEPAHFVTSRPRWLFASTLNWMARQGIRPRSILMASEHKLCSNMKERAFEKARAIRLLKLDIYYEDELEIRKRLRGMCPNTEILGPWEAIKRNHATKPEGGYKCHCI